MSYEPTENFDALLSLGVTAVTAEALDCLMQDGYVEELSGPILGKFAAMDEAGALECIEKIKSTGAKNISDDDLMPIVDEYVGDVVVNEVTAEQEKSSAEPIAVNGSVSTTSNAATTNKEFDFGKFDESKTGPDPEKLKQILDSTGYSHEITEGLRRYGGPPPGMSKEKPGLGTEVFVNRIPRDIFEDSLIPLFGSVGKLWELRVLTTEKNHNRGHGFVTFCNKEDAKKAIEKFNKLQVRPGVRLNVALSVQFNKLHLKNIPKEKTKDQIKENLSKIVDKLETVSFQIDNEDAEVNLGFCFLKFDSYFEASNALRKLRKADTKALGWSEKPKADWAIPTENPDEEAMKKATSVKVSSDGVKIDKEKWTDDLIKESFSEFGEIEKIARGARNVHVHYKDHESAMKAVAAKNGKTLADLKITVLLNVPLSAYAAKKKEALLNKGKLSRGGGGGRGGFAGNQMRRQGVDARQFINRKSTLAGRIGGPPMLGGGNNQPARPTGDVRSQLGNKRKMQMHAPPPPLMRQIPPPARGIDFDDGMYMSSMPPPRESMVMEELMMLRRRNEELNRSLSMGASPPKRMYSGPSTVYDSAYAMATTRELMPQAAPPARRVQPMREAFMRPVKQEPFYEDDSFSLSQFGAPSQRSVRGIGARSMPMTGSMGMQRSVPPAAISRPMRQIGGAMSSRREISSFGDISREYGGGGGGGEGFEGGFTRGRGAPQMRRGGMAHSQIPPARGGMGSRIGASYTRF